MPEHLFSGNWINKVTPFHEANRIRHWISSSNPKETAADFLRCHEQGFPGPLLLMRPLSPAFARVLFIFRLVDAPFFVHSIPSCLLPDLESVFSEDKPVGPLLSPIQMSMAVYPQSKKAAISGFTRRP